ncbi:MAG: hypothetical protein GY845_10530 [Planctomycetes bacterium]|nr:hypothetical protein [Planctomycetota bacterium]
MKHENDNEWLDPMLERQIHHEPEEFDFEKWAENHPEEARLLNNSYKDAGRGTKTKSFEIWRFIMENKVTRYSAAAVVALAAVLVLFGPFGTSKNGSIVLADVQEKIAGIETMIIRGTKTYTHPGEDGEIYEFDGVKCEFDLVKYSSTKHGFVEEGYAEGNLFYRITFNLPEKKTLITFPPYRKYLTFASLDDVAELMEGLTTPNGFLDLLLEGEYKKLGKDKIDEVEVEGFEFHCVGSIEKILPKLVFDIKDYKGKVWIGIKEQLPVRMEGDLCIGKCFVTMFNELNLHEVNVLDKYNVELDENIFDINPPEGYTEITLSDILLLIPVEAKAGVAGLGIIPAGFVVWKRRRRKKAAADPG